jgi:hypothetical protein
MAGHGVEDAFSALAQADNLGGDLLCIFYKRVYSIKCIDFSPNISHTGVAGRADIHFGCMLEGSISLSGPILAVARSQANYGNTRRHIFLR